MRSAPAIRRAVAVPVDVVAHLDDVVPAIVRVARRGDVVITLGAGSIGTVADRLVEALEPRSSAPRSRRTGGARVRPRAGGGCRPGGTVVSAVAAQTDRRFRRAHVKPARESGAGASVTKPLLIWAALMPSLIYGVYRHIADRGAGARAAGGATSPSAATSGCRREKCWRCSTGSPARACCGPISTCGARA